MKKIILTVITSLTFAVSMPLITHASPLAYPIERLSGQDRIDTALSISQEGWESAETVLLSEYSAYPDSIASTPLAVKEDAPILLTQGDKIDPRVIKELERLKPKKVILLGGIGTLKPSLEKELDKLKFPVQWERIGGADRYETSILLAKRVQSDSLILANGDDFPDALSAASFAGIKQIPIVLTSKSLPDSVLKYLSEAQPKHLIVIGGEGVIPTEELTRNNLEIEVRLGGIDRYETNAKVVSYVGDTGDTYVADDLFLASGITFPDAVAGTVIAAKYKAPLLLTEKDDIPVPVYTLMREHMRVEPPSPPSDPVAKNPKLGKVTAAGGLNLRETPASTGNKLVIIPEGTTIEIIEEQGNWFKTEYQSKTGWVLAEYVALEESTSGTPENEVPPTPSENQPLPPSNSTEPLKGKITASGGLNLRETPTSTGNKLITIPPETTIEILEKQGDWYKTVYQSKTGWVHADYVTVEKPLKGVITASGGLNLRETPDPAGQMLITIPAGTIIEILEQQDQWYKTTFQSKTGWISSQYVSLTEEVSASNSSSTAKIQATATGVQDIPAIDLSPNGTVYILGGTGVISSTAQDIIEGRTLSKYKDNQREFPPLPSEIKKPEPPSRGGTPPEDSQTNPQDQIYDPSTEVLVDPFRGIPANALSGKKIMIDPGHGGPDVGAVGPNHTYEKNNNLEIALALGDILEQAGAEVVFTRDKDVSPALNYSEIEDLKSRVELANQSKAELFISIHNDAFTNPETQGSSVFYSSGNPKQLESLHLASSIRTAVIDTVQTKDRGVKEAGLYVLRNTTMPAILLETAFITNPYEEARLQNPTFQKNVAAALFKGIFTYYNTPLPKD